MDFLAIVSALDEQDALFSQLHPRYRQAAAEEARRAGQQEAAQQEASAMVTSQAAASTSTAVSAKASTATSLSALVAGATELASGARASAITFLEQTSDPRAFKVPVLSQTWDSMRGMMPKAGAPAALPTVPEVFVAKLPNFNYDIGRGVGCNTLFVQGEYNQTPGYDYAWMTVNIAPHESLQRELLCHANFRIDPVRIGGGTGAMKRRYVQGYKVATWETKTLTYGAADFPVKSGLKFWWRIVIHPAGYLSYLNGKLVMFSPHPPRGKPLEWDTLYVQLPLQGEKGEKASWKVHQVWWGTCGVPAEDEKLVQDELKATGRDSPAWSEDEVRVSSLVAGVTADEVRAAFAHYNPTACMLDTPASAVIKLTDPKALEYVLKEMEGATSVRGVPMHVARVLLSKRGASMLTASGFTGAGGGAGAYGGAGGYGAGGSTAAYTASVPFGAKPY